MPLAPPPAPANPMDATALCVSLIVPNESDARRLADLFGEAIDQDEAALAIFENPDLTWSLSLYLDTPLPDADIRTMLAATIGADIAARLHIEKVVARDWVRESLEGLKPVAAGRFLVHGSHDRMLVRPNQTGIEIEAALAFGTGHHGTTRGCLILLDQLLRARAPRRILDLGSGTGVLAIAAAKATRRLVLASDIDVQAAITARDNARLNGVSQLVRSIHAPDFGAPDFADYGPFDLVLANILAGPLKRLAAPMGQHLASSAIVILSGLLPAHANGVLSAYRAQGLTLVKRIEIEGWTSLLLQR